MSGKHKCNMHCTPRKWPQHGEEKSEQRIEKVQMTVKCESPDGARVTPEGHEERRSLRPVGARADNPWFDPQSLDFKATGRRVPVWVGK